jgi:hypothetical protein
VKRIVTRLGSTVVIDETICFVPRHDYPIDVTTRVSALHPHGDVIEACALWHFGNRAFVSVAYSHKSRVAAVRAEASLVGALNTMRGLDVLGTRRAA